MFQMAWRDYIKPFISAFGIYIAWILVFYVASRMHASLCTPPTIIGFILAPFLVTSPHCQGLRWVIYNGGNSIAAMWIILAAWIMTFLTPVRN
jgi:hypothetical protein